MNSLRSVRKANKINISFDDTTLEPNKYKWQDTSGPPAPRGYRNTTETQRHGRKKSDKRSGNILHLWNVGLRQLISSSHVLCSNPSTFGEMEVPLLMRLLSVQEMLRMRC